MREKLALPYGVYEGETLGGKPHGKGKLVYKGRDVYEGDFVHGELHGEGKYTWTDSDHDPESPGVYEGGFANGKPHGKGRLAYLGGNVYEGDFADNIPHGKGKLIQNPGKTNETVYEGDFVHGKMTGKGKKEWPNGDVYEGDFVNAVPHGKGKETSWHGTIVYEGGFVDGKGTYTSKGLTFVGEFVKGMQSTGKCAYKDGTVKEGNWKGFTFYGQEEPPEDKPYKRTPEEEAIRLRYEICP